MAEVDVYKKYIQHPDDWAFVRGLVHHAPAPMLPALFCAYLSSWRDGAMKERVACRKENAGRRAANSRIRADAEAMQRGDKDVQRIYWRLVNRGPKQTCATCQYCDMEGVCKKALPGTGNLCEQWKADFL